MTSNKEKKGDKNLALISLILGAVSIFYTVFTGIPAIITGIIALKKKLGNPNQAKIGIALGIFGSLLIIPIIIFASILLRQPLKEQFSVSQTDRQNIGTIIEGLNKYKINYGSYPECGKSTTYCSEWDNFYTNLEIDSIYNIEFENNSLSIEDRPSGTIVYAFNTTCLVNTPADPASFKDEYEPKPKPNENVALIYFYDESRACFTVKE